MATKTDQAEAYEKAYQFIVSGRYFPGERIPLRRFADDLGFGLTAARYAVKRLSAIGALVSGPTGAIALPFLSYAEFSDVIDVLRALEIETLHRIIDQSDRCDLSSLVEHRDRYREEFSRGDIDAAREANVAFWFDFYSLGDSSALRLMIEMAWVRVGPAMRLVFKHPRTDINRWYEARLSTHDGIIQALMDGDAEKGEAAIDSILDLHRVYYRAFSTEAA